MAASRSAAAARRRVLELFQFDCRLECYTLEAKRKYGYFVLLVLHRGLIKARLDARIQRQARRLVVKNLWLEPDARVTAANDIRQAISRFAEWQDAESVLFEQMPAELRPH